MGKLLSKLLGKHLNKIVFRVLAAMGISTFVFVGADQLMDILKARITSASSGVASDVVGLLALGNIDVLIGLVLSAHLAVFSIRQAQKFLGLS